MEAVAAWDDIFEITVVPAVTDEEELRVADHNRFHHGLFLLDGSCLKLCFLRPTGGIHIFYDPRWVS
jgi:hypothetical protein